MIVVVELLGVLFLGAMVWIMHRFARSRPDDPSFLLLARVSLGAWVLFAISVLVDFGAIARDPWGTLGTIVTIATVVAAILGYRWMLGRLKDRAGR